MAAYDGKSVVSKLDILINGSGFLKEDSRLELSGTSVSITTGTGATQSFTGALSGDQLSGSSGNFSFKLRYISSLDILTGWAFDSTAGAQSLHAFTAVRSPLDGDWRVFAVINKKGSSLIKEGSSLTINGASLTYVKNDGNPSTETVTHNIDTLTKAYSANSVRLGARFVASRDLRLLIGNIGDGDTALAEEGVLAGDNNTDTFVAVKVSG